jgi:GST-like protein
VSDINKYVPPKVWTWDSENGGEWAKINRPIAGPTHETVLPRGKHPLQLHSLGTPNCQKIRVPKVNTLAFVARSNGAEEAK